MFTSLFLYIYLNKFAGQSPKFFIHFGLKYNTVVSVDKIYPVKSGHKASVAKRRVNGVYLPKRDKRLSFCLALKIFQPIMKRRIESTAEMRQ